MEAGRAAIATSLSELPNVISNFSIEKTYTTIPSLTQISSQVNSCCVAQSARVSQLMAIRHAVHRGVDQGCGRERRARRQRRSLHGNRASRTTGDSDYTARFTRCPAPPPGAHALDALPRGSLDKAQFTNLRRMDFEQCLPCTPASEWINASQLPLKFAADQSVDISFR